jgi:membrane fusion protein (multidrug efflux system)
MSHTPSQAEHKTLAAVASSPVAPVANAPIGAAAADAGKSGPNWRVLGVLGLIALVALGAGGRMWYRGQHYVETENAFVAGHVHPVSARIAGVVSRVLVEDNASVKAGDVIAELDPGDQRVKVEQIEAQIASAGQQVVQADAQLAQVRAQASGASAQVAQSEAQLVRARLDAERYGQLYSTEMKAVSKAEVDAANASRAGATADLAARRDNALAAQAQIGAAGAARDVIKAQIAVLQVQLKDAQQQLGYNRIVAPVDGRIGKRSVEVGARVQAGQQLVAIVQQQVWVVANFKETQLAHIVPGQAVKLVVDAMPGRALEGRVESFSPASGNQFALLPADNATGNFTKVVQRVPVKIVLRDDDIRQLGGRLVPGMSVQAEVELGAPAASAKSGVAAH